MQCGARREGCQQDDKPGHIHASACVCASAVLYCIVLSSFFFAIFFSPLPPPTLKHPLIQPTQLHDTILSSCSRETNCSAEKEMYICAPRPPLPNRCKPSKQEAGRKKQPEKCISIAPHIYLFKTGMNNCRHAEQAKKRQLKKEKGNNEEEKNM